MSSSSMTVNSTDYHQETEGVKTLSNASSLENNGTSQTGQHGTYNDSSVKQGLIKSQSSLSISAIQGSDNYVFVEKGSATPISWSKENLIIKGNGRSTIGHEPRFRDRLPSFTICQQPRTTELQTHFAVYKFVPRHPGEVMLNAGDAVFVKQTDEDLWCEGRNLRTGESGVFPSRYVSDILSHAGAKFGES